MNIERDVAAKTQSYQAEVAVRATEAGKAQIIVCQPAWLAAKVQSWEASAQERVADLKAESQV